MKTKGIICFIVAVILTLTSVVVVANADALTALVEDFELYIKRRKVELIQPIVTIDGRSFLPMRELANLLEYDVQWNEEKEEIGLLKKIQTISAIKKDITETFTKEELKELNRIGASSIYGEELSCGSLYLGNFWLFGIEYFNRANGYLYTVLKSDTDHYLVHLFPVDRSISDYADTGSATSGTTVSITSWYAKDLKSSKDFESLEIEKSTLSDVKKIDPYLSLDVAAYGMGAIPPPRTTHRTFDGKVIYIEYGRPYRTSVSKITVRDIEEDLLYFCLTPEDREVILAPLEPQNRPDQQES